MSATLKWNENTIKNIYTKIENNVENAGKFVKDMAVSEVIRMGAVDTGALRDSIYYSVNKKELSAMIGTDIEYGKYVELGTYKMPPRPFLRNSINLFRTEIIKILTG